MKNKLLFVALSVLIYSCKPALDSSELLGTWKYLKVENPNKNPPDSVNHYDLQYASPNIRFTDKDSLIITWGGKVLSHGVFTVDKQNVNYTEDIPGGKRKFPFYVSKIDGKHIVFETPGEDGTRVTAVKE